MFQPKTLFHYTDPEGAKGIAESNTIKASRNTVTDARFGEGNFKYQQE